MPGYSREPEFSLQRRLAQANKVEEIGGCGVRNTIICSTPIVPLCGATFRRFTDY